MENSLFAFVLMPFDAEFDDIYKLGIKKTADSVGITAERVDEQIFHKETILQRIYNQIDAADLIVADMTSRNPNVFYEVGYAHAKSKLCILIAKTPEDIPFDLKHHRHIVYGKSISNLCTLLEADFKWAIDQIKREEQPVSVSLISHFGHLDKDHFFAIGSVDFVFDFHNKSDVVSPEIQHVYFYTGSGWTFKIDGSTCPSTTSDIYPYKFRHLINIPNNRLQKKVGWFQIKLSGKKKLASKLQGDELKDNYYISGKSMMRVVTDKQSYDFTFLINFEIDVIPF